MAIILRAPPGRRAESCVACGCTEHDACLDPATGLACYWIEEGLCSACGCALPGPNLTAEKIAADYRLLLGTLGRAPSVDGDDHAAAV